MAEILLAAGAAYLGLKAARKVRSAYSSAKQEAIAEQEFGSYYEPEYYYTQQYDYPRSSRPSSGYHHHSSGRHSGYPRTGGSAYRGGRSHGYY